MKNQRKRKQEQQDLVRLNQRCTQDQCRLPGMSRQDGPNGMCGLLILAISIKSVAMSNSLTVEVKPTPWQNSYAKKLLTQDILDGKIDGMSVEEVHNFRPEYGVYKFERFKINLKNLISKYEDFTKRAQYDNEALAHDLALNLQVQSKPYPTWQGSVAEQCLKEDIDQGKHLDIKPQQLLESRPEYSPWSNHLKVFRDHIQQEVRARKERPYWMARRKEKEEEKQKKEEARIQRELERIARKKEKEDEKCKKEEAKLIRAEEKLKKEEAKRKKAKEKKEVAKRKKQNVKNARPIAKK